MNGSIFSRFLSLGLLLYLLFQNAGEVYHSLFDRQVPGVLLTHVFPNFRVSGCKTGLISLLDMVLLVEKNICIGYIIIISLVQQQNVLFMYISRFEP